MATDLMSQQQNYGVSPTWSLVLVLLFFFFPKLLIYLRGFHLQSPNLSVFIDRYNLLIQAVEAESV